MEHWLREQGATLTAVRMQTVSEHYREARLSRGVNPNTVVLSVPYHCLLTGRRAREVFPHPFPCEHTALALLMLRESADPLSFFQPYLQLLPPSYESFAINFRQKQLATLEACFVQYMISARNAGLKADYDMLPGELRADVSLERFRWARTAVITRLFRIERDGTQDTALVPLADMLNHSTRPNVAWGFDANSDAFRMTSTRRLCAGQELTDSYGDKCNSRFFVNYGFALADNEANNQALLFVDHEPVPACAGAPRVVCDGFCHYPPGRFGFQLPTLESRDSVQARACFSFLRLVTWPNDDIPTRDFTHGDIAPLSAEHELAAVRVLAVACEQRLAEFKSSIDQNRSELKAGPAGARRDVLLVLISEKTVLHWYLTLAQRVLGLWQQTPRVGSVDNTLRREYPLYRAGSWGLLRSRQCE